MRLDPTLVIILAAGFAALACLLFVLSERSECSVTTRQAAQQEMDEADQAVAASLHAYAPRSFKDPAAKGINRTDWQRRELDAIVRISSFHRDPKDAA